MSKCIHYGCYDLVGFNYYTVHTIQAIYTGMELFYYLYVAKSIN